MIYQPQNMTCKELLELAGFTSDHSGSRGMIRPYLNWRDRRRSKEMRKTAETCVVMRRGTKPPAGHRLHAVIEDGAINLHYDFNKGSSHQSSKFCSLVRDTIKELEKLDTPK